MRSTRRAASAVFAIVAAVASLAAFRAAFAAENARPVSLPEALAVMQSHRFVDLTHAFAPHTVDPFANLDQVPEAGAVVWITFPKVEHGSGFPARVIEGARPSPAHPAADVGDIQAGAIDPLTKELIYMAVSVTNGCPIATPSRTIYRSMSNFANSRTFA